MQEELNVQKEMFRCTPKLNTNYDMNQLKVEIFIQKGICGPIEWLRNIVLSERLIKQ